jgi:nucleotide-binding universal stress UspA family protein
MFHPRLILHPTDYSEDSLDAFRVAVDLARLCNSRLLVLHAVETLGPENVSFGEAMTRPQPETYRKRLEEDLRQRAPHAPSEVPVEYLMVEGDPAHAIEKVAAERRVDLIVMSTHGLTGLKRLLMGSLAEHVIRNVHCPVLVTKRSVEHNSQGSEAQETSKVS